MTLFILLALLAQAPSLPPDHPPVGGSLPPNHPPVGQSGAGLAPSAEELLKRLDSMGDTKKQEMSFEVAMSVGKLYASRGRYRDGIVFLELAVAKAEPVRAFYLQQSRKAGSRPVPESSEVGCTLSPTATLQALHERAKELAKTDAAAAAACARAALHGVREAQSSLGQTKFLLGDFAGSLLVYEDMLTVFSDDVEALYGRGALLLDTQGDDLKQLARARSDFQRFLAGAPKSPKARQAKQFLERVEAALAAGGVSKLKPAVAAEAPTRPPVLTQETMDAFAKVERTPEMEDRFKKLVEEAEEALAKGKFQDALTNYKQVMPFQPDNPRLRAGMAWTMVRLNRQPMAEQVWRVATGTPEAIDALGDSLKAKGDAEGAKAVWTRLRDTVPAYAPKLQGKL